METKEKNRRKLLLVLPILILPFLALGFYALGGGRADASLQGQNVRQGINTDLPDAQFKKVDPQDKLSLYELAGKDTSSNSNQSDGAIGRNADQEILGSGFAGGTKGADPNEKLINDKLAQINKEINRPAEPTVYQSTPNRPPSQVVIGGDVDRLEKLMHSIQGGKAEDPEMQQLSEMLDKIMSIQNPGSVPEKAIKQFAHADSLFRAIPALIVNNQKAVQGATIRLRLQDTITLSGQLIPKGHDIYGTCRITNQRLMLDIKNIRLGTSIIPVDLSVYSLDGMPGVDAPEAMLVDAAGGGADDALRSMRFLTIDQSLVTQATSAGIDAAKSLFSKKIKSIKVKLKAGQAILLRNNQLRKY
jgi:hypothetical protein